MKGRRYNMQPRMAACLGMLLLSLPALALGRLQTFGRVSAFEQGLVLAEGPIAPGTPPSPWPYRFPADILEGHEGDLERVKEYHALIAPLAINNTIIIVPANSGFIHLALNLRCRLLALNSTNVVIWALDNRTAEDLLQRNVAHFYDPTLYSVPSAVGYGTGQVEYSRMMSERPKVWWRLLATGFSFIFLDADVVAFDRPENAFEFTADFEGQLDFQARLGWGFESMSNSSTICAGVFLVRSSAKSLAWMDEVSRSFSSDDESKKGYLDHYGHWDDQIALNYLIHHPNASAILNPRLNKQERRHDHPPQYMTVLYSHPMKLLGGDMLAKRTTVVGHGYGALFRYQYYDQKAEFRPSVIHFNGRGKDAKVQCMKDNGWWDVDDSLNCKKW